jgi:two-component sensor histidine kinase
VSLAARWGLGILAVTLLSIFSVTKEHVRWQGDPFWRVQLHDLILWYSWLALTPVVFAAARRFPIEARRLRNVVVHVPLAFAVIFAAALLRTSARQLILQNQDEGILGGTLIAFRSSTTRLSDLLREALDDDAPDETTLDEELRLLDRYVDIQRIRFGDRLQVSFDIDPAARLALVPRLILQPLVENAVQHGVGKAARGGRIDIIARSVDGRLVVTVRDDGPGARGEVIEGVGLGNTRARLAQLFGADHELSIDADGPGFAVSFTIPARAGAHALTA